MIKSALVCHFITLSLCFFIISIFVIKVSSCCFFQETVIRAGTPVHGDGYFQSFRTCKLIRQLFQQFYLLGSEHYAFNHGAYLQGGIFKIGHQTYGFQYTVKIDAAFVTFITYPFAQLYDQAESMNVSLKFAVYTASFIMFNISAH